jgi:hypothetical protein
MGSNNNSTHSPPTNGAVEKTAVRRLDAMQIFANIAYPKNVALSWVNKEAVRPHDVFGLGMRRKRKKEEKKKRANAHHWVRINKQGIRPKS